MAALTCSTLRQPYHGACSSTPGRVRQVIVPSDCWGVFVQQEGGTGGTLYVTNASSEGGVAFADEAASPTLVAGDDVLVIPTGENGTLLLGPPTATGSTRSIWVGSDTASATFKAIASGIEVMR